MSLLSALPLESLLKSKKIRTKICDMVVSILNKNMGEATTVKIQQQNQENIEVLATDGNGQFWKISNKEFFNVGIPFDITGIFRQMTAGMSLDFESGYILLHKEETGALNMAMYENGECHFSGDLWTACESFISENASAIASNKVAGELAAQAKDME